MIAATMTSTRAAYSTAGQTATATSRPVTQPPWCTLPRRPPRRPGLVVTPAEPLLRCWTRAPSHGREPISIKGSGLCHVSRSTIFSNATAQHGSMTARREGPGGPADGPIGGAQRGAEGQVLLSRSRPPTPPSPVSYTHLRAHETRHDLVCRLLLE